LRTPEKLNNVSFYISILLILQGVDVLHAGLATHYIPSELLPELQNAILHCISSTGTTHAHSADINTQNIQLEISLRSLLNEFQSRTPLPSGELTQHMKTISRIFGGGKKSLEEMYNACKEPSSGEFGKETAALMAK
jgi:hypothetical protein